MNSISIAISISLGALILAIVLFIWFLWNSPERRAKSDYRRAHSKLGRSTANPLMSPRTHRTWEEHGTFNPAAILDDEGRVHLLYRAIGTDGISRVGHAVSSDGINFEDRSTYPVYEPTAGCGLPDPHAVVGPRHYEPLVYTSGGGWGGAEDPRAVRIGDRVYMSFTAFGGWDNMRIAVTSISLDNLKNKRWRWKRATFLSPPKSRNKNWVLFPEKIDGRFAIMHGISPKILIDYVDNIDEFFGGRHIESAKDHGGGGYRDPSRVNFWDNRVRGVGTPPIKTEKGWLFLYHGIDSKEPHKYKVGAMLLDLNDPSKVLYRSPAPILEPDMHYENDGKPGIVYASGAVVKDGRLLVYYGGGDKHVCAAEIPLNALLNWLIETGAV